VKPPRLARFFDLEPDLLGHVPAQERSMAHHRTVVRVLDLGAGDVDFPLVGAEEPGVGFLVLDGILLGRVDCFGERTTELIGTRDIIRPLHGSSTALDARAAVSWTAVEPAVIAILDDALVADVHAWPRVAAALFDRLAERATVLAAHLAIAKIRNLDARLLCLLWFAAQRWGTVSPDGLTVRLPVSHGVLAELASARRPSVSSSLKRLRENGLVSQLPGGRWCLAADAAVRGMGAPETALSPC
jgi:CRP/FNR family transcriptional regulator, cyclic AMP receptor protein